MSEQTYYTRDNKEIGGDLGKYRDVSPMVGEFEKMHDSLDEAFQNVWDDSTGSGKLTFKGDIAVAADFPAAADVMVGWVYRVVADVTDDDPTKTNTGLSFSDGDEVLWVGATWASTQLPLPADLVTADAVLTADDILTGGGGRKAAASGVKVADLLQDAGEVPYDNSVSGLVADNVQEAIDELAAFDFYPQITKSLYIDGARTDTYLADGSILKPFKNFADSLTHTSVGTILNVFPATYTEDVVLPAGVSVKGMGVTAVNIVGDFTVSVGSPISLHNLLFSGTGKVVTIHASTAMLECYISSRLEVAGSAVVQAWNTHVIPSDDAVTAVTMLSSGKFQPVMSSIISTGDVPTISQSDGSLITTSTLVSGGRAGAVIDSVGGTVALSSSQVVNNSAGIAVDVSSNDGTVSNPNLLGNVVAVGNVVCGAVKTIVEGLQFVQVGVLSGTDLVFRASTNISYTPADGSFWVDPDPITVKEALDRMASLLYTLNSSNPIP